jgi:hypothetical protein
VSNRGYVLIARGLLEHPRFKPQGAFSSAEAWIWLIESAAHTARDVTATNGRHRVVVHLEPGQLTFSVRFLAGAWRWSDKRVQRFLSALVLDQSVTTQTTTGQTLITLCNWDRYQRPNAGATTQTATQSTTQTTTKRKELNELNDVVGAPAREPAKPLSEKVSVSPDKQAAVALGLAFLQAANFVDHAAAPKSWRGVTARAAKWIDAGWSEQMIVAETRAIIDRITPTSINYFELVFTQAHADASRGLPVASASLPGTARAVRPNRRGNISDAADELIARARAAEQQAEQPLSAQPPFLRLLPPR